MPQQDTTLIKDKVLQILRRRGPSLPVHIAKETNQSILFASAFLAELLSEKKIKISDMKVGSSPIYFIPGQEFMLERFSQYLKSKEKDAFLLLREKRFLEDRSQTPAIRVALRSIRDFAVPFKRQDEIYWRYYRVPEAEFKIKDFPAPIQKTQPKTQAPIITKSEQQELDIFDKSPKPLSLIDPKLIKSKKIKKISSQKVNEKFFNKIKEYLNKNLIVITDIVDFSKNDVTLIVKDARGRKLLVAYNKRRISESDIIHASKKAQETGLPFIILSLGEPLKKLSNLIEAIKNLEDINRVE